MNKPDQKKKKKKEKKPCRHRQQYGGYHREEGGYREYQRVKKAKYMVMEDDLTSGGGHTIHRPCTIEMYT